MMSPADNIPNNSPNVESGELSVDEKPSLEDGNPQADSIEFEKVEQSLPKRPRGMRQYWLIIPVILIAVVSWIVWGNYLNNHDPNQVPLVKAMDGPFKIRPTTPGGMPIPNRDKTVYDTFEKKTVQAGDETLLPEPEQLLPMPQRAVSNFAKQNSDKSSPSTREVENLLNDARLPKKSSKTKFEDNEKSTETRVPIKPKALPSKVQSLKSDREAKQTESKIDDTSNTVNLISPPLQKQKNIKANSGSGSSQIVFPKNSFQVQLAAVRNKLAAQKEWERLKLRHAEILGNLNSNVVRADLGAKGIYYRLRAGPLVDRGSAKTICRELQKIKVNCLVIRPGR